MEGSQEVRAEGRPEVGLPEVDPEHSYRSVHDEVVAAGGVTILEFFDNLPWTRALGYEEWATWRAWLAALFGLPLDEAQFGIFQTCTGLQAPPEKQVREAWLICGRRSRKSAVAAIVAAYLAVWRTYRQHLAPGSRAIIPIIAQSMGRANEIMGYLRGIFLSSGGLSELVPEKMLTRDEWNYQTPLNLSTGVTVQVYAASYRTARGFTAVAAVLDEIAFWYNDDASKNPDAEILKAIRPGLATIPNSLIVGLSSPYAQRGVLWERYERHYAKPNERVLVWKAPTKYMWPQNKQLHAEIDEAYAEDPQGARSEWGAEFRADIVLFCPGQLLDGVTVDVESHTPVEGHTYYAFCDASGGTSDSFTLSVGHWEGEFALLDFVREWRAPFDPERVTGEVAAELKRWGLHIVTGDRYAGKWPMAMFRRYGITYQPSRLDKTDLYLSFLPLITSATVELLKLPRLRSQLTSLERRTARTRDLIDHPPGGHDDVANAVAGCMVLVNEHRREWVPPPEPPPKDLQELHKRRMAAAMRPGYQGEQEPFRRKRRVA